MHFFYFTQNISTLLMSLLTLNSIKKPKRGDFLCKEIFFYHQLTLKQTIPPLDISYYRGIACSVSFQLIIIDQKFLLETYTNVRNDQQTIFNPHSFRIQTTGPLKKACCDYFGDITTKHTIYKAHSQFSPLQIHPLPKFPHTHQKSSIQYTIIPFSCPLTLHILK